MTNKSLFFTNLFQIIVLGCFLTFMLTSFTGFTDYYADIDLADAMM